MREGMRIINRIKKAKRARTVKNTIPILKQKLAKKIKMKSRKFRSKILKKKKSMRQQHMARLKEEREIKICRRIILEKVRGRRERQALLKRIRELKIMEPERLRALKLAWLMVDCCEKEMRVPKRPVYVDPKLKPELAAYLLKRIEEAEKKRDPAEAAEYLEHYRKESKRLEEELYLIRRELHRLKLEKEFGKDLFKTIDKKKLKKFRKKLHKKFRRSAYSETYYKEG